MKVLVTGAKGFIGKNLVYALRNHGYNDIDEFDVDTNPELLTESCKKCDFVFHLAGVNRPKNVDEFKTGNNGFTEDLLNRLKVNAKKCPVVYASSIQAELSNPYGQSKKEAEQSILRYADETGAKTLIYRLPNVFGKWCKPNYNSVIATFCYNIANDLPIAINDGETAMNLVYIDDLTAELLGAINGNEHRNREFCFVPMSYTAKLAVIADIINGFALCRDDLSVPNHSDDFVRKIYSTYLSYLPKEKFKYPLDMHRDSRGSFTEFIRTPERGQLSVNISKPGIIKGNHWHNSKNEKFLVVSGKGVVRFRMPDSKEVIQIEVSGDKLEVVEIPPGYTHSIENTGDTDMVTLMWANEPFDPENHDTYYLEVQD